MSAFEGDRLHFTEWLKHQSSYIDVPENILANVYVPRKIYSNYLQDIWNETIKHKHPFTDINIIENKATNIRQ